MPKDAAKARPSPPNARGANTRAWRVGLCTLESAADDPLLLAALQWSRDGVRSKAFRDGAHLDTLALVLARVGRWAEAVRHQLLAIQAMGPEPGFLERLRGYLAHEQPTGREGER